MNNDYRVRIREFINTRDYIEPVEHDKMNNASHRDDIGLSSLSVIMLVADFMKDQGVEGQSFQTDWVFKLDQIDGICSVFQEIERMAA